MNISNLDVFIRHDSCIKINFDCDAFINNNNGSFVFSLSYYNSYLLNDYQQIPVLFKPDVANIIQKMWGIRGIHLIKVEIYNYSNIKITIGIDAYTTYIATIAKAVGYLLTGNETAYLRICSELRHNNLTIYYMKYGSNNEFNIKLIFQHALTPYKQQFEIIRRGDDEDYESIEFNESNFQCTRYGKKHFKPFLSMLMANDNYKQNIQNLTLEPYKASLYLYNINFQTFLQNLYCIYPGFDFVVGSHSAAYLSNIDFNGHPRNIII